MTTISRLFLAVKGALGEERCNCLQWSGPAVTEPGPRLADVAAEAGVSLSTASRALHASELVKPATRRRVEAAARRLGYEPNRIARSLRTRSSTLVGMIVPDVGIGFYART